MKKYLGFFLAIALLTTSVPSVTAASNADYSLLLPEEYSISEYEMVLQQAEAYKTSPSLCVSAMPEVDPILVYKNAFTERATLPAGALKNMGYSDEQIQVLKDYINGDISFEEAATRASATITSRFDCSAHTAQRYRVKYMWEWNLRPTSQGEAAAALGLHGIDNSSSGFATAYDEYSARVAYSYNTGGTYKSEVASIDLDNGGLVAKFPSYKMDDLGNNWVWAKSGYITVVVIPAVSGGKTFSAVRANGEYGYTSNSGAKISVGVSYNPMSNTIGFSFSVSAGGGSVNHTGKRQSIFSNNGTELVEYPKPKP